MITGFVGKVFLNGSRASDEEAVYLARGMVLPEGYRTVTNTCGALAVATAIPNASKYSEEEYIFSDGANHVLVGSGSIYNRDKLIKSLQCREDVTELELIRQAWLKWGNNTPEYLDGDWMFAAYDRRKEELLLARSWGHSSLYFYRGDGFIAFATQPKMLSNLPGIPCEPDINVVLKILCALPVPPEATSWKGIYQLQPASKLKICQGSVNEHIWWRPSFIQSTKVSNENEMLEKFALLYTEAVKKRLRTSQEVGATLSGGLDSSSVCLLAAQQLAYNEKSLYAWTSAPQYTEEASAFGRWLTDERALASKISENTKNIKHKIVEAESSDPINAIRMQILRTGRPQSSVANLYWIDKILMLAADSACGVLLTGQFGNSTVSYSPFNINMLPKGKYFPNTEWKSYLALLKLKMIRNMVKVKHRISDVVKDDQVYHPLINHKYVQSKDFKRSVKERTSIGKISHADVMEIHMGSFDIWYHHSLWSGVEVRDPTMDKELTEYLLSLPDNMFFCDGMDRRLIRLAMTGMLPDEIRLNKRRGQQASDIVPRVRHFKRQVEQALEIIDNSMLARDLLNMEQMHIIFNKIVQGETGLKTFQECSRILLPGLSVALFLASLDADFDLNSPLV